MCEKEEREDFGVCAEKRERERERRRERERKRERQRERTCVSE